MLTNAAPRKWIGPGHRKQAKVLAGRAGWNLADQLVSSGTNLMLSIIVARTLSANGFGAFAIALAVYSLLIGAARALIFQPLVVRYTSKDSVDYKSAASSAAGFTTVLGVVSGIISAIAGIVIGGTVGASLIGIGVLLPGLLLQDMWRLVFVAEGRPAAALLNDTVWAIVQFGAIALVIILGQESPVTLLLAWGGAALVAALAGIAQFKSKPKLKDSFGWMWMHRDLLGYYLAGFLSVTGAYQITTLLIGAIGSLADVGALRAAAIVLGPLNIAGYSLSAFALPEVSRRQLSGGAAVKVAMGISGIMLLADLVWVLLLLVIPDSIGAAILGDSWPNAQSVLPASVLGLIAIGIGFGPTIVLSARGFAKETFWISTILAPAFLVFGLVGLHFWAAPGAAAGFALAQLIVAPVCWWRLIVLMRREAAASGLPVATGTAGREGGPMVDPKPRADPDSVRKMREQPDPTAISLADASKRAEGHAPNSTTNPE